MSHTTDDTAFNTNTTLGKLTSGLLIVAALYSLYLVLHDYIELWFGLKGEVLILDNIQIQRATHVFLLLAGAYLISAFKPVKRTLGSWVMVALSLVLLGTFWFPNAPGINLPVEARLFGTAVWALAMLPVLLPQLTRVFDLLCAAVAIIPLIYQIRFYEELINRAVIPAAWDQAMSIALIFLVLGAVYRFIGPVMPALVLVFVMYNLYAHLFPGAFRGAKNPVDVVLGKTFNETEAGIYGFVTGVSAKYLVYFTILSGLISSLGLGRVVANIALAMVGKRPGTPGRVTGIASVFMGMFSGSGAADTQFVATLAKPLFERGKYDTMIAAGLVATAGTIAIITPPVLGSIAFIMVENLSVPYSDVMIMSLGPCLLYLLAVFAFNEFYTRKAKLEPVGENFAKSYALRYSTIFIPIILIIAMLYNGFEVATSASVAALVFIAIAYLDPTLRPKGFMPILAGLRDGFRSLIPIGVAVTAANLIFNMLVTSGLAARFSQFLEAVASGNLLLALLLTAVLSLILGMGVPPTATYVLTAALTAPAIIKLAEASGIPGAGTSGGPGAAALATHMFLFYYAVLADVTPPVALSAFASASVFKTDPIRTGVYAARVALAKYLIGFFFLVAFSGTALLILPVLQNAPLGEALFLIVERFLSVGAGIIFLSAATVGYTRWNLERWETWVLGLAAFACFIPNLIVNVIAIAVCLVFFVWRRRPETALSHG